MSDEDLDVGLKEPKKAELGTYEIIIPKVYAPIFTDKKHNKFLLSSGRCSGKTSILVDLIYATINAEPDKDIVILQATSSEIKDSIIVEIEYERIHLTQRHFPSKRRHINKRTVR
jgi:hypothetical protein